MRRRYTIEVEQEDGWTDWIRPIMAGYGLQCCDCGLVHHLRFRVVEDNGDLWVEFKASLDNRATAQVRRRRKEKTTHVKPA